MKKHLLILILSCWHLNALETASTLRIYHDLFASLLHKSHYSVYTDDRELSAAFAKSSHISLVNNPSSAEALVITKSSTLSRIPSSGGKLVLTTKYSLLRSSPKIIGAFYWRKGRAQLLFVKKRLERSGISLPGKYRKYTVNAL